MQRIQVKIIFTVFPRQLVKEERKEGLEREYFCRVDEEEEEHLMLKVLPAIEK